MRIFSKIYIVSHSRERSEKTCLNCNTQLHGRFCHVCGQENTDPRESIWSIISHFFNDITHFDGKFFTTAGKLLVKPGFLPLEFIKGRRASYLHPIRLYVFTSAVFFIIFYAVISPSINKISGDGDFSIYIGKPQYVQAIDTIRASMPYKTIAQYDSAQQTLPPGKRDGWFTRKLRESNFKRMSKYEGRNHMMASGVINNFIHTFPYLLFVSLPICALFLQLLFITNKNNVFAGHTIYLVYLYVFTFLVLLVFFRPRKPAVGIPYRRYTFYRISAIRIPRRVFPGFHESLLCRGLGNDNFKIYSVQHFGIFQHHCIICSIYSVVTIKSVKRHGKINS